MKKLIILVTLLASFLFASPTFAYTVKSGDTMSSIAREYHLSLQELAALNPQIKNLDLITIDQVIETTTPVTHIQNGYSQYEKDLLARLVRAEAETEPYEGKIAVACVVLNRVASKSFPDTIQEVIYERGQFQPVRNGQIDRPADEDSIKAVDEALGIQRNTVGDSLFFYNPDISTSRWLDTRATTIVIGRHVFKK
ncbi:cell wall hydrolase [Neobacillus jeddahensis]|uniref:cell wall hydrolase n=1 Tax=Neobacillus jeddahensis TaxID=1461580 RepID=UPI00058DD13A|nr:cell wall hydrolase [Neobacillus jeddahensis]